MPFILPWHCIRASWRKLKQNSTLLSAPRDYPRLLTARHYLMWRPCLKSFFVGTLLAPWVSFIYVAVLSLIILFIAIRCTRTDDTYEGYFIPAGSYVFVNIWWVCNVSSIMMHIKWCKGHSAWRAHLHGSFGIQARTVLRRQPRDWSEECLLWSRKEVGHFVSILNSDSWELSDDARVRNLRRLEL